MTLSDRDRKLLLFIVPVLVAAAYWFVMLSPVRSEGSKLGDDLAKQEQTRDQLKAQVAQLGQARDNFATDYAAVVELGKAVPSSVDMPSLLVQLDKASHGTGIDFERIQASARLPAAAAVPATGSGANGAAGTPRLPQAAPRLRPGPARPWRRPTTPRRRRTARRALPPVALPRAALPQPALLLPAQPRLPAHRDRPPARPASTRCRSSSPSAAASSTSPTSSTG